MPRPSIHITPFHAIAALYSHCFVIKRREWRGPKDRIVNGELTLVSTPAATSRLRRRPTRKLRCR